MTMSSSPVQVVSFYLFVNLTNLEQLQADLEQLCRSHQLLGTVLLAPEGINGAIAGLPGSIQSLQAFWADRFSQLTYKTSWVEQPPFHKLKIKIKPEIISLGIPNLDPSQVSGVRVAASDWNQLLQDPEVIVIDTRNEYEIELGSFVNAINPGIDSFREFPQYVQQNLDPRRDRKIAMFCTGGIRCEKASALMLELGFAQVYQLEGGILQYLEQVEPAHSLWQGECFVFDHRVSVDHHLSEGSYKLGKGEILPKQTDI
ncbi:MAG: rhodanese-related sulfurtransferase [Pseudanabaenaceae cyanobacterium bins.68]|nr:rhodanese-related sulfurtransferase [Pseudanabaenaceae cyanobacterium bins.68]